MVKPVWNNSERVNHQNIAKKTYPYAISVNTARQVNTAHSNTTVNAARPMSYLSKTAHSTIKRPIHKNTSFKNSNIDQRVNTVSGKKFNTARPKAVVNAVKGSSFNAVKASACWVWKPKTKVLDHVSKNINASITLKKFDYIDAQGRSKHMTQNMSYITDYEEIDGGYIAFGGNPKGGKITRKCTIKTGNLDFENVYFVRELKFNLFSVSQMCDKKNSVLFNDTECIVLSPNFKLIDESQVLLRVPRKNNMYSVDLKNIVPKGGLTYLFAKATSDESKLWYRRLCHFNFKTLNKLVKGNLVRGYLLNFLKMMKPVLLVKRESSTKPLDETSGILKSFINGIENLVDHKVKVIRCDNGTEFKNREMNQFCEMKGILRQFSVARTPQQNGVAKRRNRTLIEASRTMLTDSKLPTTFWAEAVNTACYVQNKVLVVKPHNKTPYELFHGRTPTLSFMRPFGCPVTILNTIDHLGKFDGKADEGFFVGYSLNSSGLDWLFDIDALTRIMNYEPIVAGTQSNDFVDLKSSHDDGSKPLSDDGKKVDEDPRKDSDCNDQEKEDNVNSTNNVNAASTNEVNDVGEKTSIELPFDPVMHALEDYSIFDFTRDDEDDGFNTAHEVSTASTQVNAAYSTNIDNLSDAVICAFFASQPNSPQLAHEDLQQIHPDDIEEIDLRWQMVMLTMRDRSPKWSATTAIRGDILLGSTELQEIKTTRTRKAQEGVFRVHGEITIRELRKKLEIAQKEKDDIQLNVDKFEHASKILNKLMECQDIDNCNERFRDKKFDTARPKAVVNVVKGNNLNAGVWWQFTMDLHDQGVIDSGCSRHMKGNISYLTDYEEIDGGYVAFGGNPKGGKITGKCTIKTSNLDFEKLIDESQVLLRVSRKNNMYSVDLKNIVPKGGLTFLFANATSNKSKLWHRRLGHLNFKTMNKLVKENLVRGLPSKLFENDQTCVACQKGKQKHRASDPKSSHDDGFKPSSDDGKKDDEDPRKYSEFEDPNFLDRVYKVEKAMYGLHQAPRAWHKGDILLVQVYVDDIIFWFNKKLIHEKFQMSSMGELTFFLGLQVKQKKDGIFISQDKYVAKILKKFGFTEVKTTSTPMETQKPLLKDKDGEEVDVHMYRSMIGSLMYLTSSRPDIMFAVYQAKDAAARDRQKSYADLKRILKLDNIFNGFEALKRKLRVLITKGVFSTGFKPQAGVVYFFIDHFAKYCKVASDDLRDALSVIFGLSELKSISIVSNRIVEENLHIRFSKNTPNTEGSRPDWLFDINALTRTTNYEPIVAGTHSHGFAGTKANDNVGQARKETKHVKDYILLPLWLADLPFSQDLKSSQDEGSKSLINDVGGKTSIELPDDPNMLALEDISIFDLLIDNEDVSAEADMNNLDTTIQVSPIPTTRIYKDHPLNQVIRDLQLATQTRNMSKNLEEYGFVKEGIEYDEVYAHVVIIEAIRLFLAYASFKDFVVYQMDVKSAFLYKKIEEEVYVCQPPRFEDLNFPDRVYKVEKALSGLHQAPRAWYETLSTYLLDNEFQRGKINKTLFIKRYKGDILLQKKDGIFISQDKYVGEILKKFRFTEVKTTSTPMETQKPLLKDEDGKEVDVHMYRSMIGSLMYLTSSRPDIMFAVCACARYQVNPKVSHLHAVKRIFRYLKGQPKLGLWYPKDSPFDLVAYTDSDYVGASLDRKSTTGGCQFLGCRLISWQCKKQTVVANSTTKAEYVAASKKAKKSVRLIMEKLVIKENRQRVLLMLLGINLLLLLEVNAARHNLLLLLKVNAARHNLLLLLKVNATRHKLTTAGER
ncbi:putative ribonuclease H-like domain-containing protein [Tanacetum coccineum]|uniref:Ribonuclease H-like domain-containing protein n=1 Tax=Tanacetum coccineum TaxID=301880 RepID=A0ABQ4YSZ5_9ASTR